MPLFGFVQLAWTPQAVRARQIHADTAQMGNWPGLTSCLSEADLM